MAATTSGTLTSLLRQTKLDDHEHVLHEANLVLTQSPQDTSAQHIRVIALLKLDRYDEALEMLDQADSSLKDDIPLARAYALYKSGRLDDALHVITQTLDRTRGLKHIEAQVAYRAENFAQTAELYEELSSTSGDFHNESDDLRVNTCATNAQQFFSGGRGNSQGTNLKGRDLQQFEIVFNAAATHIAQGSLKQAEFLLKRARDLCTASADLSAVEKDTELLPITVQQLYVLSRLGKVEEAEALASGFNIASIGDFSTRHIAQVNLLSITGLPKNSYLWDRSQDAFGPLSLMESPFRFQVAKLEHNRKAVNLKIGKYHGVSRGAQPQLSAETHPSARADVVKAGVLNAAAHARGQAARTVLKQLLSLFQKSHNDVGLLLTIVQLYVLDNDIGTATLFLEAFLLKIEANTKANNLETRFAPGLVAVLVSLYAKAGRLAHAKSELMRAAAYWRQNSGTGNVNSSLFEEAAIVLLQDPTSNELQVSHEYFELAHGREQARHTFAGLSASSMLHSRAQGGESRLPAMKDLIADAKTLDLEKAGVPRHSSPSSGAVLRKREAPDTAPPALKKARRAKLSKSFDPSVPPDPERWLPLRDRSNWRPKGKKKGRATAGMSTQGGVVSEDSRPATPIASQVVQQAKPRKKKGKAGK